MIHGLRMKILNALTYLVIAVLILGVNLPFLSMASTALKERGEALSSLKFFPEKPQFGNFAYVLGKTTFGRNIMNSAFIALSVTLLCICITVMAGYALSRFKSRFFSSYGIMLLVLQLFPGVLMLIPLFIIFSSMGLIDTHLALIIAYTTFNLPFSIWMIRGFMSTIPFDIEQAAMIDGSSQFGSFVKIIIPISTPGISTVGIFTFINAWGEYTLASILLRDDALRPLTVGLQKFVLQFTSDWPALMAASTIATVPTLFFLVFAQKYLVKGLSAGAVKG